MGRLGAAALPDAEESNAAVEIVTVRSTQTNPSIGEVPIAVLQLPPAAVPTECLAPLLAPRYHAVRGSSVFVDGGRLPVPGATHLDARLRQGRPNDAGRSADSGTRGGKRHAASVEFRRPADFMRCHRSGPSHAGLRQDVGDGLPVEAERSGKLIRFGSGLIACDQGKPLPFGKSALMRRRRDRGFGGEPRCWKFAQSEPGSLVRSLSS
jgi:hypothetical protein